MAAMDEAIGVDVLHAGWLEKKGGMRWSKRYFEVQPRDLSTEEAPTPTLSGAPDDDRKPFQSYGVEYQQDCVTPLCFANYVVLSWQLHCDTLMYYNAPGEDKARGELVLNSSSTVGSLSSGDATGFQVIFAGGKALKVDFLVGSRVNDARGGICPAIGVQRRRGIKLVALTFALLPFQTKRYFYKR
jgi:hypothetical protein